jgi:hypothetical protein
MFSFVTGKSLSCIIIDIIDDNIAESKETLSLILQPLDSSPGVRISRGLSTVEIIDNDAGMFTLLRPHKHKKKYPIVKGITTRLLRCSLLSIHWSNEKLPARPLIKLILTDTNEIQEVVLSVLD